MLEITTKKGKHKVLFYDSDMVLPIRRYQRFNLYLMIAANVGETMQDYDKRTARSLQYLTDKDIESSYTEIMNRRDMVYNALSEWSPKGYACALMVHSIDGEFFEAFDEDSLNKVQDKLDHIGFTRGMLEDTIGILKKKLKKT